MRINNVNIKKYLTFFYIWLICYEINSTPLVRVLIIALIKAKKGLIKTGGVNMAIKPLGDRVLVKRLEAE